jgi:hypothetical protein
MKMTTTQLAKALGTGYRRAYRLADTLHFMKSKQPDNTLIYYFGSEHPLVASLAAAEGTNAKPIYTISEIAKCWEWKGGTYSRERVRQRLDMYDVPIWNRENKGLVYLTDLQAMLEKASAKIATFTS